MDKMTLNYAIEQVERMVNVDDPEYESLPEEKQEAIKLVLETASVDIDKIKSDEFIRGYTSGYGAGKTVGKRSSL